MVSDEVEALQNPKQIDAYDDPTRHRFLDCGRRGGKTFLLAEMIQDAIQEVPPAGEVAYIGPTNQHAMELMWEPLETAMEEQGWQFQPRVSKSRFELPDKRKIYVISAELRPELCRYQLVSLSPLVAMDELAYWEVDLGKAWRAIRPTLSDLKGRAVASTTPDGKGTQAYQFYLQAKKQPEWAVHHWTTLDNPYIDPDEIEDAKRELDALSFAQEYEASWETMAELAYYSFDENIHIVAQPEPVSRWPIKIALDFNVNPTTLLVTQYDPYKEKNRVHQEYSLKNSSTEETAVQFCEDWQDKKHWDWRIRGDAAGKARSSGTGKSDYHYLEEVLTLKGFNFKREVPAKNPAIIDRVKYMNGWMKPVKGSHRIEIDPSCDDLILDLSSQGVKDRKPDKSNPLIGHKADALG